MVLLQNSCMSCSVPRRCRAKYGSSWQKYSELVPYKMIPYVW